MDDILLIEVADGVATVTLNRPRQMNALSSALRRRFGEALAALGADDAVRAVVITGAGEKAFTAGVDLKELETAPLKADELGPDSEINRAFRALGKPTVAAVNGFAITGGLEIAINCDILVASTNARFADTHARVGIVPGWGLSQKLSRLIGISRAKELSFTGNFIDAHTSEKWGLVNRVYPAAELVPAALKLATEMTSTQPVLLKKYKALIDDGFAIEFGKAMKEEVKRSIEHSASVSAESVEEARKQVTARGRDQQG